MCKCVGWGKLSLARPVVRGERGKGKGRKWSEGRDGAGKESEGKGFPLPNSGTVSICSRPHHRLSINLSQCKHSKYSLWLLVKTM